jgi:hypothetical protein
MVTTVKFDVADRSFPTAPPQGPCRELFPASVGGQIDRRYARAPVADRVLTKED